MSDALPAKDSCSLQRGETEPAGIHPFILAFLLWPAAPFWSSPSDTLLSRCLAPGQQQPRPPCCPSLWGWVFLNDAVPSGRFGDRRLVVKAGSWHLWCPLSCPVVTDSRTLLGAVVCMFAFSSSDQGMEGLGIYILCLFLGGFENKHVRSLKKALFTSDTLQLSFARL